MSNTLHFDPPTHRQTRALLMHFNKKNTRVTNSLARRVGSLLQAYDILTQIFIMDQKQFSLFKCCIKKLSQIILIVVLSLSLVLLYSNHFSSSYVSNHGLYMHGNRARLGFQLLVSFFFVAHKKKKIKREKIIHNYLDFKNKIK